MSASDIQQFSNDHAGAVASVADMYQDPSLKQAVVPEILNAVTVNGAPLGIVTGVHRNDSFLYNKQIFDAQGIAPPTTVDEFMAACAKLKTAGITPVAMTFQGWALRIMFDEVLAGILGAQGYADFLNSGAVTSKVDSYDWSAAAAAVHDGKAAMYMHGDWAKGYVTALGWTPGVDFGVSGPPGAPDLFIYGADMFGLPAAAPHPDTARHFLEMVASKDGQVAFNRQKGSTPMRTDVRDQLDEPGKLALDNLMNAKVLMKGHANASWDPAFDSYAKDGDKAALLQVYMTATP
jgi:glucose/mannose transport system substrate-binding protein